jgi:tetratricopeptide (TPR) repeat protein
MDAGAWNDAEGLSQRALRLMQERRWDDALEELESALALDPFNAANHYHLGVVLDELRRTEEAVEAYERADAIHPDHPDVLNRLALDVHTLGQTDRALELFARVERVTPAYEPAYCNHVALLVELGRHEEAEEVFYLARLETEHCPRCSFSMGSSMATQGRHDQAVRCFRRAMDLPGASAEVNRRLGESLLSLGDRDAARVHFRQSLSTDPNHTPTLAMMVGLLIDCGAVADAQKWLDRLRRRAGDDANGLLLAGRLAIAQFRFESAQRLLERAIQLDPTLPRAHQLLAELYRRQGRPGEARQHLHAELLLGPHDEAKLAEIGRSLLDLGDLPAAAGCYRRVVERKPSHAVAWINLGICECERGDRDAGVAAFRTARSLDPRSVAAHHNLALALSERGDWSAAMAVLAEAIAALPRQASLATLRRRLWLRRVRRWLTPPFRRA